MRTSAGLRGRRFDACVAEASFGSVGLGTAPTARADSSAAGRARLEAVVARGVEWIDTAGIYGLGTTERSVGAALVAAEGPHR